MRNMIGRKIARASALMAIASASTALANNPPSAQVALSMIGILPFMMLCSLLGGYYALSQTRGCWSFVFKAFCVVAVIIGFAHEVLGALVVLIFSLIALIRAVRMIWLGFRLRIVMPTLAGLLLLSASLFTAGMPFALFDYSHYPYRYDTRRIERVTTEVREGYMLSSISTSDHYITEIVGASNKFSIYLVPQLPVFPYNYITPMPSLYLDETGVLRRTNVNRSVRCPSNAPVVKRVSEY